MFLAIFGLILAMFLTFQSYGFDTFAHAGVPLGAEWLQNFMKIVWESFWEIWNFHERSGEKKQKNEKDCLSSQKFFPTPKKRPFEDIVNWWFFFILLKKTFFRYTVCRISSAHVKVIFASLALSTLPIFLQFQLAKRFILLSGQFLFDGTIHGKWPEIVCESATRLSFAFKPLIRKPNSTYGFSKKSILSSSMSFCKLFHSVSICLYFCVISFQIQMRSRVHVAYMFTMHGQVWSCMKA